MDETMEINIEEIMNQIREDIRKKGYTSDILSFQDIMVDNFTRDAIPYYDSKVLLGHLDKVNQQYQLHYYHPLEGSGIKKTVKRSIRKLMRFVLEPIITEQVEFNANVVRCLNQIELYIQENEKRG